MKLGLVTLGVALGEVDHEVREVGGNNRGPRIAHYLRSLDPPINDAAPWCAAMISYVSDVAAQALGVPNPLDGVRHEAYVQSFHDWASAQGLIVQPSEAEPGDLVLFDFRGIRWDHIGIVLTPPDESGGFRSVEGNTGDRSQRDGDGVFVKGRRIDSYPTAFVRWAP